MNELTASVYCDNLINRNGWDKIDERVYEMSDDQAVPVKARVYEALQTAFGVNTENNNVLYEAIINSGITPNGSGTFERNERIQGIAKRAAAEMLD